MVLPPCRDIRWRVEWLSSGTLGDYSPKYLGLLTRIS
jgi:hypothetical protein